MITKVQRSLQKTFSFYPTGKMCGETAFDPAEKECCCGDVFVKKDRHECCGKKYINTDKEKCCNSKRANVVPAGGNCP
jgi:hypothetical protein